MPAYCERVYLCPNQSGQPGWIVDFPAWWNRREFFNKYGDRQIDTGNPFYVNYGLLLTQGEAIAWDKHCREAAALQTNSLALHRGDQRFQPLNFFRLICPGAHPQLLGPDDGRLIFAGPLFLISAHFRCCCSASVA